MQVIHNGLIQEMDHPTSGTVRVAGKLQALSVLNMKCCSVLYQDELCFDYNYTRAVSYPNSVRGCSQN